MRSSGRVVLVQPAVPTYRTAMFVALTGLLRGRLRLIASGEPLLPESQGNSLPLARVRTYRLPGGLLWQAKIISAVCSSATRTVVLPWNTRYLSHWIALLLARALGKAALVWGHGYSKSESAFRHSLRSWMARLASGVVFYDDCTAQQWRARHRGLAVFVCRNGLDQVSIAAARAAASVPSSRERKLVLFCSRLFAENRTEEVIDALCALPDDVRLGIIGDGPHRGALMEYARRANVADRVEWHGPVYDEACLAGLFGAALCTVYPANGGLSIVHAMSYGCPPLIGDDLGRHGPEARFVRDGINGLLYRSRSVPQLAELIRHLLKDRELWARLSHAALATASDLDTRKMADSMLGAICAVEE